MSTIALLLLSMLSSMLTCNLQRTVLVWPKKPRLPEILQPLRTSCLRAYQTEP